MTCTATPAPATAAPTAIDSSKIDAKIRAQGDIVRKLKSDKADKETIASAVKTLLDLKEEFKQATGNSWTPDNKSVSCAQLGIGGGKSH